MPPACPTERVFLVISVLLCHFEEGTKEARTREISRIRASDQLFRWNLREKFCRSSVELAQLHSIGTATWYRRGSDVNPQNSDRPRRFECL